MYQIPKNPQLIQHTPILLICGYYAILGSFFALGSCSYIGTLIIGIAVSPPETLISGMNAEIFWTTLLLLLNTSRLALLIGLLKTRRWAYRGIITLEISMGLNLLYEGCLGQSPMTIWPLFTFFSGVVGVGIMSYLAQTHIRQQFKV